MTNLLVFREQLRKFYSKYELYLTPIFKFLLALVTLVMINSSIGYMSELKKSVVVLVLALICSFLPMNFIVFAAAAVTLGHLYKFSMECALVALVVFLLLFILYFRFSSNDAHTALLHVEDTVCDAHCDGTCGNAVLGSVGGRRHCRVLYGELYDRQRVDARHF